MKYTTIVLGLLLACLWCLWKAPERTRVLLPEALAEEPTAESLPNIIVIITDDQRYDDFDDVMPLTKSKIFDQGLRFNNAFVTTPACCPSRANIFTGLYTSEHAVRGNRYELNKTTFMEHLKDSYYTGLIGKYLNSWDGSWRPEFDYWMSFPYGRATYYNPKLNINGNLQKVPGYSTYIFRDAALEFLEQARNQEKPFMLILAFNAPHFPYQPANEDRNTLIKTKIKKYPSFDEVNKTDKPVFIKNYSRLTENTIERYRKRRVRQRECLLSVDRSIDKILEKLDQLNVADDTAVFYLSDNGLLMGEHGAEGKDSPYDESVKIPFALRYPKLIEAEIVDQVVANIDIAPTIYELANIEPPYPVNGNSLIKLLSTKSTWRSQIMLEGFRNIGNKRPFAAIRSLDYLYIRNMSTPGDRNINEFYDLKIDPFQLRNRIHNRQYSSLTKNLDVDLEGSLLHYRGTTSFTEPRGTIAKKWQK